MAKIALLFATGTEECEALNVVDILRRAGEDLNIVSINETVDVTGAHGIRIIADETIDKHDFSKDDVLIIPGGNPGAFNIEDHPLAGKAVDDMSKAGKLMCAICAAPMIYGHKGLLKGRKACIYPGMEAELEGAEVSMDKVIRDGNFITSRGLGTAIPFALEILAALKGRDAADKMAKSIVFND